MAGRARGTYLGSIDHDALDPRVPAMPAVSCSPPMSTHQLRFVSLFHPGRALSFPCDASGRVELDELGDRARDNYLYARAVVGREFATPEVVRAEVD